MTELMSFFSLVTSSMLQLKTLHQHVLRRMALKLSLGTTWVCAKRVKIPKDIQVHQVLENKPKTYVWRHLLDRYHLFHLNWHLIVKKHYSIIDNGSSLLNLICFSNGKMSTNFQRICGKFSVKIKCKQKR